MDTFSMCYHGTIQEHAAQIVRKPDVKAGRMFTDFGQGFYVTSHYEQAKQWALWKAQHHPEGAEQVSAAVVRIELDTVSLQQLTGLVFREPNDKWAEFVYTCRKEGKNDRLYHDHDFICGPLADGKFVALFNRYQAGKISFEEFHTGIRPYTSDHNQLSLHTVASIACIQHMEVQIVETIHVR